MALGFVKSERGSFVALRSYDDLAEYCMLQVALNCTYCSEGTSSVKSETSYSETIMKQQYINIDYFKKSLHYFESIKNKQIS